MKNSDLDRPVGLEHVEQPLANRLFLLRSRHIREVAGVEVYELVPGGGDGPPPFHGRLQETAAITTRDGEERGEKRRVAVVLVENSCTSVSHVQHLTRYQAYKEVQRCVRDWREGLNETMSVATSQREHGAEFRITM